MRTPELERAFGALSEVREYVFKNNAYLNIATLQRRLETVLDQFAAALDEPENEIVRPSREVTQIEATEHNLYALCADGTMWVQKEDWEIVPPIPTDLTKGELKS